MTRRPRLSNEGRGRSLLRQPPVVWACLAAGAAAALCASWSAPTVAQPAWPADAAWYQVFPERFANGDAANDPTRESIDDTRAPATWEPSRWNADWYARAAWERDVGPDFYADGVFMRRYGGDLQGLIDRLGYLHSLGITALYLNPVFHAPSLHKYDAASMHHIDPYFGPAPARDLALMAGETDDPATWSWTSADSLFLELISAAHERRMRVVIDGVFNHTGTRFFAFEDFRRRRRDSPYSDWYITTREDDPATPADEFDWQGWWDHRGLPVFADAPSGDDLAPGPKAYVLAITRRWMDPDGDGDPADGIDGWRLDVAEEVPAGFWRDWHTLVRSFNPEALTVAEIWSDPRAFMDSAGFHSSINYHGFAIPLHDFLVDGTMRATAFLDSVAVRAARHAPARAAAMLNLADSHDTDRLPSMLMNPDGANYDRDNSARHSGTYRVGAPDERARDLQRIAFLLQATLPGAPMVYYGDEAGMWGGDDPDDRKPMLWSNIRYDDEATDPRGHERAPDAVSFDRGLHDYYRDVLSLRRRHAALRRGTLRTIAADDAARTLAFARDLGDETLVVLVNAGEADASLALSPAGATVPLVPILATRGDAGAIPSLVATFHDDGTATYHNTVPARTAVVFRRARAEDVRPGGLEE